jgi:GNAT superfamily N-acetyltransferase
VEEMQINEVKEADLKKVVEFLKIVTLSPEEIRNGKGEFEEEIENAFGCDHMLVATKNDEIIGFSRSQIRENKQGKKVDKVIMLLIDPEKYGEGIGGELIEKERKWAKEIGVNILDIEVR